ncbi:SDR family NAD(P)-dependent oxidoreductase [Candidatus Saccharibacteria bacterium]|nr:MAG: SDR family NAD(P)-dependent oxidoreductase [Candidatus Saccharibacteria bacterium]
MKMFKNTILITGGGSGIGKGLAEMFHRKGNKVIIAGRNKARLEEVAKANEGMETLELDVTTSESIDALVAQVYEKYPDLNVLILNAGMMKAEKIGDNDIQTAKSIIATNLIGQMELNSKLLPILEGNNDAVIVTVSSGLAFIPGASFPSYCATKAAIHSYTQSLRTQLKNSGIQVIELIPPYVQTELISPEQANDPNAMPLADFITEVTNLLENNPEIDEIQVERVKYFTDAVATGEYEHRYNDLNQ